MSTVVIFPGGFQPFHAGHKSVYDHLVKTFPDADVYIASSPSTTERPFNFDDKKYLAISAGIPEDKFVMVKSPYRSIEITQNYNPEKDVVIFALSEKDSSRLSYTKKDGSPGYFQPYEDNKDLNSFGKNGYVYITPKISFKILDTEIDSASKIRSMYKNASEQEQNNILKDMYPGGDMKKIKTIFDNTLTEEFDFYVFLEEGFKEVKKKFIDSGSDQTEVDEFLNRFRTLSNQNKLKGDEKNIDLWGKKSFNDFKTFVTNKEKEITKTQIKTKKVEGNKVEVARNNKSIAYVPLDKLASCNIGKYTDWCTTKVNQRYYEDYISRGITLVYVVDANDMKPLAALAVHKDLEEIELFDPKDEPISNQEFLSITGFNSNNLAKLSLADSVQQKLQPTREKYLFPKKYYIEARDKGTRTTKEKEAIIATDPYYAYEYARDVIKGRWPEAEPIITKNAEYAYNYARVVIKGRWPEAEPIIAKDAVYAYYYARFVIKDRFPEGEPAIAKAARYAHEYAKYVIKGRWPEGEPEIAKNAVYAYYYARFVIKDRFPEGEPAIAKAARYAHEYAIDVIKGRFPEGEPAILENMDSYSLYTYARFAIKGRWPEAEPIIAKNAEYAHEYAIDVIKGRFPEGEPAIAKDPYYKSEYEKKFNVKLNESKLYFTKKLNEEGIYASYKLTQESAKQLTNWIKETGIKDPVEYNDLHVTTTYSRNYANIVPSKKMIHIKNETYSLDVFGEALVLRIDSPELQNIHDSAIQNGATSDYLKYNPHITLSYNAKINEDIIMTGLEPPKFDIILSHEEVEPLQENIKPKRSLVKVMKEYKDIKKKISGIGVEGKATEDLQEIIQKKGSQWVLKSKKSGKVLGKFPSKKKALKREKQIQYFKHIKEEKEPKKLTKKQQKIESRLETLLRYGLVPKNLIARSRRALFDQKVAAKTPYLRDLLIDILDHVLKMVLDNPILYHRLLRDVMIKGPIVQEEVSDNNENDKNIEIPEKVVDAATDGIALRKEFNRGGTSTIVTLSKKLIDSEKVDQKFIKKLQKSLKIHTPKRKEGWDDLDKPSNEYITWKLLGGDESVAWVEKTINNIEEE